MSKIEEHTLTSSEIRSIEISLERPRKYPAGLPIRLGLMCRGCSRHCTINLRLPEPFPSAFVANSESVFSSLCEKLAEVPVIEELDGQLSLLSDASEG